MDKGVMQERARIQGHSSGSAANSTSPPEHMLHYSYELHQRTGVTCMLPRERRPNDVQSVQQDAMYALSLYIEVVMYHTVRCTWLETSARLHASALADTNVRKWH